MEPAAARLLIVDDNEDNRYTLLERVKRLGYSVVATATNGREALEMMQSGDFDLVLLDVMMPQLNGYEVLERMKADQRLRETPVIMISALDQVDSVIRCIELGAEDYLPKPFNPTLLRARVDASLEKKRLRDVVNASLARLETELEGARRLQLGMLPREFPSCSENTPVELYALMEPAREVGGDLYDFFCAGDLLCFFVADVSGKGADAAMFMARTRSLVRMAIQLLHEAGAADVSPGRILNTVNRELCQNNVECMFVTVFLAFLDVKSGVAIWTNAGHPPPYLLSATGRAERISRQPQPPLGLRAATTYANADMRLQPGDTVFVCTDGVAEAANSTQEMYGNARLEALLTKAAGTAASNLVAAVKSALDAFASGAPPADDMTMLAIRWRPV